MRSKAWLINSLSPPGSTAMTVTPSQSLEPVQPEDDAPEMADVSSGLARYSKTCGERAAMAAKKRKHQSAMRGGRICPNDFCMARIWGGEADVQH